MNKNEAHKVLSELSRKLFMIESERKSSKRKELIESILFGDESEMKQLKELLKLEE